jgi:hypothetical protein
MTYETMRAEFRELLVNVINKSTEFTLKAHLALADPTRIPALQIVDAIICLQEVRSCFAKTYGPFVRLTQQYLQAEREDPARAGLPETKEVALLIKAHNKCMRGLANNERFFYDELYLRAKQPSEHASALQKLGVLATKRMAAPEALNQELQEVKATLMQP